MAQCKATTKAGNQCQSPEAYKYKKGMCLAHIRKYHPELAKDDLIKNKKKKMHERNVAIESGVDTNETKGKNKQQKRESILSIEYFDLKTEIEVINENSDISPTSSKDPLDLGPPLQKQKLFAQWLNSDDLTRTPQTIEEVGKLFKVTVKKLKYWRQGVTVRKFMADQLDFAMRYDARKMALEGFLELLQDRDSKAILSYMGSYIKPKNEPNNEKQNSEKDWKLNLIEELPDDTPANRRDKFIKDTHGEAALKLVAEE